MKKLNVICLLLFINFTQSQELITFKLLPPDSKEHKDFHFLEKELQDKHLVMLGEMTHMYGNIFEMKARVIEYLHQELGFNTIAMESPMYGLWLMNKNNGFTPREFNDAIFGVWSSTSEFQRLVNYVEKNNIKVIGFDSQVNNVSKFIEDFFDYCNNNLIKIKSDKDDIAIVIEGVLESVMYDDSDIEFSDFENEINRIIDEITKLQNSELNYYWLQFVKSLLASSRDAYYSVEDIITTDYADKQYNFRDEQMADNLISYIKRHPKEKIICWADNIHIVKDMSSIKKPIIKDFIPMGSHIKKALGNTVYSLATLHANDSLLDNNGWHSTPILKSSFEHKLKSFNTPYLFVSSNQGQMRKSQQHRLVNFNEFTEGRLDQLFDGYIFLNHATKPKNQEESTLESKVSQSPEEIKIALLKKGETTFLKGKIINAENNAPVPYANIIVKNEEIYRIADENGFFEFSVNEEILSIASVSISSMGYETQIIPLNELPSVVFLVPSFEQLDEVILKAKVSPKLILKKAIDMIKNNHPVTPFNSKRYIQSIRNKNDKTFYDVEYITKEYDQGYRQPYISTRKFEHIKRNKTLIDKKSKNWLVTTGGRENAIQYANILHKRKYKKFDLKFVKLNNPKDEDHFIIAFSIDRNKWNYTNRGYPTNYSGKIFINKGNYAISRVIQNWETTLNKKEIEKFKFWLGENVLHNNYNEIKIKQESICNYQLLKDGKYYANRIYNSAYSETTDSNNKLENNAFESNSIFFETRTKKVEEIEYLFGEKRKKISDVKYNPEFWKAFYEDVYPNIIKD